MPGVTRRGHAHPMEYLFLIAGIAIGTVLAVVIVGFTAVGQYERGYRAGRGIRGHIP